MFSLLHYLDCPGSPASISCLTASLASLYVLPVNTKWGWWQKLLFCMGNWSLHDADQSLVSCKLVISSKCIQYILGTISKLHIWICSFELTYLMKDRVSHKVQKKQSCYIPRQSFSNFLPNSTQQVSLSYSQELQSIHATVDFKKAYIW